MFVEIENVDFSYPNSHEKALKDFTYTFEKGQIIGILGASGSGKSTLLRIVAGLEIPQKGKLLINKETMFDAETFIQPDQRHIGMVFQDYALFPHMTIEKNIAYGLKKSSNKKTTH